MDIKPLGNPGIAPRKDTAAAKPQSREIDNAGQSANQAEVVFEKSNDKIADKTGYGNIIKNKGKLSETELLKLKLDQKMNDAFYLMVQDVMDGQNAGMKAAIEKLLAERGEEITPEMIEEAKEDVAEGGFFSVESVTKRIMSFAKAISGNDPSKAALLRSAFEDGFKEASKIWGDSLPQISQDTYDSVMDAFDKWESDEETKIVE